MQATEQDKLDCTLLVETAIEAGKIGLKWFGNDPEVWMKEGQSPVSEADFAIDQFLKEELLKARPDYGWLSEETDDDKDRLNASRIFVVDPIDGTRGFINGMKRWCVSVAVVENHRPVAGVLQCPVMQQTISATANAGAWCNGEPVSTKLMREGDILRVTGPRSLQSETDNQWPRPVEKLPFVPSLAYRLAMVAMGEADLSLARASAKDWDLAAADLIVTEAGGVLSDMEGDPLTYNCEDVRHGGLICCDEASHQEMLDLAAQAINKRDT